jgi:pyridoxal phosphate phosphatase PHOSPHO2
MHEDPYMARSDHVLFFAYPQHHGLTDLFTTIITNPAHWDTSSPNTLLVGRLIPKDSPDQHTCQMGCLVNMCKGDELDRWLNSKGGLEAFEKVVYVGDGGNDFCPLLRMRK